MGVIGSRLIVAFDAAAVSGAVASWGLRGLRVHAACRVPLAEGALVPSPLDPNLARPDEVRDALREVRKSLGTNGRRAVLVLPDGVARVLLVRPEAGVSGQDYARFRVAQGLPFPAGEAITGVLASPGGDGPLLAAAVRRSVVRGYEELAAAVGLAQDRLDVAPLAALSGLAREAGAGRDMALILGDSALCLALFEAGVLRVFRCRRRDAGPGEAARLRDEVERTAALAGPGSLPRVKLVGHGAADLARELSSVGLAAEAGWRSSEAGSPWEAAEMAFLGAARA
jgi:hypothetical protein